MQNGKYVLLKLKKLYLFLSILMTAASVIADSYSPYVALNYPMNVYWGDTHLHTGMSFDAYSMGTRLSPDAAYRFAQGETVTSQTGQPVRLSRPLDFLVVADHAEYLGVMDRFQAKDPILQKTVIGQRLSQADGVERQRILGEMWNAILGKTADAPSVEDRFLRSVWQEIAANADRNNMPGRFTAFSGFEWSPLPDGNNLHRVVIFGDGAEKVGRVLPYSALDSYDPERLWAYMEEYETTTGGRVLAIPHNGNGSNGLMFSISRQDGTNFTRDYTERRARWEPLYEVTQIKGDGEAHPNLSPTDEFADFETLDQWNLLAMRPKAPWMLKFEYARSALKLGLAEQAKVGVNPFKFGMIGSTDAHIGLAAVEENNFWGKKPSVEPSSDRWKKPKIREEIRGWQARGAGYASAGYAAVWATENTREALFAAMKRKEVYASTGPRMTVRFFGGWGFDKNDAFRPNIATIGYQNGVPMGGDLTEAPKGKAPSFLIRAVKDPDGANLDRVQVIKGWRGVNGELHEKIFDVALSDRRVEGNNGEAPSVGNTVDVANASYTNSIGDPELAVVWADPDFNPAELAFYYVRVLEIPTPRWTAYDAKFFNLTDIPEEVPMIIQERAYTSPIWYSPPTKPEEGKQ